MRLDSTASLSASGLDSAAIRRPVGEREKERRDERAGLEYVDTSVYPSTWSSDVDGRSGGRGTRRGTRGSRGRRCRSCAGIGTVGA